LASLAAFDIARELNIQPERMKLYTFGCPRLGNRAFAREYSQVCHSVILGYSTSASPSTAGTVAGVLQYFTASSAVQSMIIM
jgi:hypothetical protein